MTETQTDSFKSTDLIPASSVCGVLISRCELETAVDLIIRRARARKPLAVSALAVHGVMEGALDQIHRSRLNDFDLLLPDGQPVRWALNVLYRASLKDRVPGPVLMHDVCRAAAREGLGIYLYGSTLETLRRLRGQLVTDIPELEISGYSPSRFRTVSIEEQEEIAKSIRDSGASICFVGLGCPRQEEFCWAMRDKVAIPLLAVGAAFDFNARLINRAPIWMQSAGLEWLYRLGAEPRRLWRRYLLLNPLYICLVALQAVRTRHSNHDKPSVLERRSPRLSESDVPG
jgi:exopolysaccharide biosynthesis WecB/TagA/CpsF family protein